MNDALGILCVLLITWFILYILIELVIINKRQNNVIMMFKKLDIFFLKRLNVLLKMLDIVKRYNRVEFEKFGSNLYDYHIEYDEYDINKKLQVNESLIADLKKIMLVTKVYPELMEDTKYIKYERQLIKYNKMISKYGEMYNDTVRAFNSRKKVFPSTLICAVTKAYQYNSFNCVDK